MGVRSFLTTAALAAGAAAQFVTYASGGYGIAVNIPSDTATSNSGPIYFQISTPSGVQWAAFGQGSRMNNANMFVIYSSGSGITLSPRSASGHVMPTFASSVQAELLDGSELKSDGSMVANIRCDNCLSWASGSMNPTSTSSNWILAYKKGSALNSNDQDANIQQHDSTSSFTLDLTKGTGSGSSNPFAAAAASSSSTSATSTATGTAAGSSTASGTTTATTGTNTNTAQSTSTKSASNTGSQPIASNTPPESSNNAASKSPTNSPYAHGVLMSILFLGFFPFFALTLYLPTTKKVRFIHAPLQMLSVILLIVGLALGVTYGKVIGELDGFHQIIGYIVVAVMVLFQPALGVYQHLNYQRTGTRSGLGVAHQWLGRAAILLGMINGGFGWGLRDSDGGVKPYGVVAGIVSLIYIGVVIFNVVKQRRAAGYPHNKDLPAERRGYEMHNTKEPRTTVSQY